MLKDVESSSGRGLPLYLLQPNPSVSTQFDESHHEDIRWCLFDGRVSHAALKIKSCRGITMEVHGFVSRIWNQVLTFILMWFWGESYLNLVCGYGTPVEGPTNENFVPSISPNNKPCVCWHGRPIQVKLCFDF